MGVANTRKVRDILDTPVKGSGQGEFHALAGDHGARPGLLGLGLQLLHEGVVVVGFVVEGQLSP